MKQNDYINLKILLNYSNSSYFINSLIVVITVSSIFLIISLIKSSITDSVILNKGRSINCLACLLIYRFMYVYTFQYIFY